MKFKFFKIGLVSLFVFINALINVANAGLITETWQATITQTHNISSYHINDTITWTVMYDDTSKLVHTYGDGPDGVAQTSDDIINDTYDTSCPDGNRCNQGEYLAPATFDMGSIIDNIYIEIAASGDVLQDKNDRNYARRLHSGGFGFSDEIVGTNFANFRNDHYYIGAWFSTTPGTYSHAAINIHGAGTDYGINATNVSIISTSQDVLEPPTLAIFTLGMIGLVSRRLKKKSQ